ncbi:tRNA (adenosine(37)-N6)-dimethylallyltransferase MiaA [Candidatus Falkowbacteria bacterium]|nr:MAG: tRNA (adenosine(37)-N6)-dimethylallyltransferase MiaA [Candidatus Falkowbacteria bacterium]
MKNLPKLIVILGPTSSGKTKLAVEVARLFNGEIVSADSRQVYKGMDIGTGKDLDEYGKGSKAIQYHLIDVAEPSNQFNLKQYQSLAYRAIDGIIKRKITPILVGGSGLYLQAVVDGYQLSDAKLNNIQIHKTSKLSLEEIYNQIKRLDSKFLDRLNQSEKNNKQRLQRYLEILQSSNTAHNDLHGISKPRYNSLVIGINYSLDTIRQKIKKRLDSRFKQGMIEEVEGLHNKGLSWEKLEAFGLEYKYISQYLQKKISLQVMKEKLAIASGQFAKRQMTWFRRWEKQGREILWVKGKNILNRRLSNTINSFLTEESDVRGKNNVITLK